MKIKLILFITSSKIELQDKNSSKLLMKTFESTIRPVQGDLIDDPGFDSRFHNGYEVTKVTINYETNECLVSLSPLAIDIEEISIDDYIDKLVANNWHIISKEELV